MNDYSKLTFTINDELYKKMKLKDPNTKHSISVIAKSSIIVEKGIQGIIKDTTDFVYDPEVFSLTVEPIDGPVEPFIKFTMYKDDMVDSIWEYCYGIEYKINGKQFRQICGYSNNIPSPYEDVVKTSKNGFMNIAEKDVWFEV